LEGKRIVEFPILYVALKGFYTAEALADVTKEKKSKTKVDSLLISNYSLSEETKDMSSDDDDDEEEDTAALKDPDHVNGSEDEDSLDEALDCLEGSKLKDVLSSLYKQAESHG